MSNSDGNAEHIDNEKTMRISAVRANQKAVNGSAILADQKTVLISAVVPPTVSNGSVTSAVEEAQTKSVNAVPVTAKARKSKYSRWIVVGAIIGIVVVLAGGGLLLASLLKSPPSVIAYRTHMQDVNLSIGGSGITYASQNLDISFPLTEQVIAVDVKPGDQVTVNQPIIQLDLSQLNAQIQQAKDNVAATQSYLNSAAGTAQASTAQLAYDQAMSRYTALQAQSNSPTLHGGTLVAPFAGTVTSVEVQSGSLAKGNTTLITLQSESTLVAHIEIPLASFPHVFNNQDALVTPTALPNVTVHGKVSSIIQQSSAATDTFEIWVTIDNTSKQFLPGMSVFANLQEPLHTLVVPRMAVINPDQGAIVFVINDGHVTLRHVQTGGYAGDLMVIEVGLSSGDEVALTGVDTLYNGETVTVSKEQS